MSGDDIPAAPSIHDYFPDQITIYGVKLNLEEPEPLIEMPFGKLWLSLKVVNKKKEPQDGTVLTMAVAYGYAFEGHCYRLDTPKLLIFEHIDDLDAEGCGFGKPYRMFRIRAKAPLFELVTSVDLAETLILEANLPGNRTPNTYGNKWMLAHRGGRLNRPGGGGGGGGYS